MITHSILFVVREVVDDDYNEYADHYYSINLEDNQLNSIDEINKKGIEQLKPLDYEYLYIRMLQITFLV